VQQASKSHSHGGEHVGWRVPSPGRQPLTVVAVPENCGLFLRCACPGPALVATDLAEAPGREARLMNEGPV
jgi:hypothetical protein